jgi:predicted metal-dependent hydrolase
MHYRTFIRIFRRRKVVRRKVSKKSTAHYKKYKETARMLVHERLQHFNSFYGFTYNKVFIKNTRSRWGSCSSKKNLNFNYKIALIESDLADYIIVHELCHLSEFNHSKDFWALVEKTVPDYKEKVARLRKARIEVS